MAGMGNSVAQDNANLAATVNPVADTASTAPTAVAGANNGTSPPVPVVAAGSTTRRGSITFGSGSTPAADEQVVVTFAQPLSAVPAAIVVSPTNKGTAALSVAVTAITASGFKFNTNTAPTASQANTIYGFTYHVIP